MQLKPNKTVLRGVVESIKPEPDGWGGVVKVQVVQNLSTDQADDFISPRPGVELDAFYADADKLHIGEKVKLTLSCVGDERGERLVINDAEIASD